MSEKLYKKLMREYAKKNRLFPTGFRPWEEPLLNRALDEVEDGLKRKAQWAAVAEREWREELRMRRNRREAVLEEREAA